MFGETVKKLNKAFEGKEMLSNKQLMGKNEHLSSQLIDAKKEIDELKAMVGAMAEIRKSWCGMAMNDGVTLVKFIELANSTPQQCLLEHDKRVAKAGYINGFSDSAEGFNGEYGCSDDKIASNGDIYAADIGGE